MRKSKSSSKELFRMKGKYSGTFSFFLLAGLLFLVMTSYQPHCCQIIAINPQLEAPVTIATEMWSDDFEDNDISDWTIGDGDFSADGGTLKPNGTDWNYIAHSCSVEWGTWSFDVYVTNTEDGYFKVFPLDDYVIIFEEAENRIELHRISQRGGPLDTYTSPSVQGWNNYTMTRTDNAYTVVYMNGTPILEGWGSTAIEGDVFEIESQSGPKFDNIIVDNTITYDNIGPYFTDLPRNDDFYANDGYSYDINATDTSGISTWTVNNTEQFAIDSDGVLTSAGILQNGTYALQVMVNDTLGNSRNTNFTLEVLPSSETPTPEALPDLMIYAFIGGGVGIAVVAVIIIVLKKR
ncbi:MAG: hypothetical protein RTU63_08260 [Candidatus Thorarchaeota archaeon]